MIFQIKYGSFAFGGIFFQVYSCEYTFGYPVDDCIFHNCNFSKLRRIIGSVNIGSVNFTLV